MLLNVKSFTRSPNAVCDLQNHVVLVLKFQSRAQPFVLTKTKHLPAAR